VDNKKNVFENFKNKLIHLKIVGLLFCDLGVQLIQELPSFFLGHSGCNLVLSKQKLSQVFRIICKRFFYCHNQD